MDQTTNTIGFDHHTKEMQLEEGIPVNVGLHGERERENQAHIITSMFVKTSVLLSHSLNGISKEWYRIECIVAKWTL